jgi:hypothetical protein
MARKPLHLSVRWRTRPMRRSSTANSRRSIRALVTGDADLDRLAEPQQATAPAGGVAQDAGRKLVTRGRQMLGYTASHWLAGPYSSMA